MNSWSVVSAVGACVVAFLVLTRLGGGANAQEIAELELKDEVPWTVSYKKPAPEAIKSLLTADQYYVTQKDGTERPFSNAFWNNKKAGIYVDVVTGEPLFSSTHKFKSGTGWPSFYRPLVAKNVVNKVDQSHFMVRTEVRSRFGDSHLGHVFNDGPAPTGLRYCINSASLRFVSVAELEAEGYGAFKVLFDDKKKGEG